MEQSVTCRLCKLVRAAPWPREYLAAAGCSSVCGCPLTTWLLNHCLCLLLLVLVQAAALSPDGRALLDFKEHLTGKHFDLSDWNESDVSPCAWRGVTCGPDASSVSRLDLSDSAYNFEGTLSSSIGSLRNLTYLDLSNVGLRGPIPPEIANAELLTFLDLSFNELNGSIPDSIGQLRGLTDLNLYNNSLSGAIPTSLGGLANLTWLDLSSNDLSGPIPAGVSGLTKLAVLDLRFNPRISGRCLNLELLKDLQYLGLDLSGNNFTEPVEAPDLADLQGLRFLLLKGCQLEGPLPSGIARMPNLTTLDLSSNRLSGHIPDGAWGNKNLSVVDLSDNRLNGSIPRQLLQQLIGPDPYINLSGNQLSGSIPDALRARPLKYAGFIVDLSHNQLEGPIPPTFGSANLWPLQELHLQNNLLSGDITTSICFSNSSSAVTTGDSALLEVLQLQGNRLEGEIRPATCANWRKMRRLDLSGNPVHLVNDSLFVMLGTLDNLEELRLRNIGMGGKLPTSISRDNLVLSGLAVLDLSQNKLEGRLSDSQLMTDARYVFPDLRVLDLSDNRLTGQVPDSFAWMPKLTFLNLSNNRLSGRLPPLPPALFNASFFAGNPRLCGPPLEECRSLQWYDTLVFKLVAALVGCLLLSGTGCLFLVWRLRAYAKRHRQDADLIAALQGKDSANLMPLAELRKATLNFAKGSEIGVGGFGSVYKGRLNDGTIVAIKKSKRQKCQQDKDQFLNEVRILSRVNHRNLMRLLGCCLENKTALLVFEYVPNGTLNEHLRENVGKLTWKQRLRIALDTADALAYLHSYANPPIFHRDVKSANILLDEDMTAKVADFGISKLAPLDATHVSTENVQGTRGYIDPEYYRIFQLSAKSDVYSFGVVLLEIISGQAPVDYRRDTEDMALTTLAVPLIRSGEVQGIIDPAISKVYSSANGKESILAVGMLAVKCLEPRSKDRPTMKEVSKELRALCLAYECTLDSHDALQALESHVASGLQLQAISEDDSTCLQSDNSLNPED